jgi:hypothetical protein
MAGLAAQRRKLGLAASSLDIGIVYGIGYVNRVGGTEIYNNLRKQGYLPISERDIHHMFIEAISSGSPSSNMPWQISTGLQRWDPAAAMPLHWQTNPIFSHHMIRNAVSYSQTAVSETLGQSLSIKDMIRGAQTEEAIASITLTALAAHLEALLHLAPNSIDKDKPIVDLGVDSLVAVGIRSWFLREIEKDMPVLKILGGSSPAVCKDRWISLSLLVTPF